MIEKLHCKPHESKCTHILGCSGAARVLAVKQQQCGPWRPNSGSSSGGHCDSYSSLDIFRSHGTGVEEPALPPPLLLMNAVYSSKEPWKYEVSQG